MQKKEINYRPMYAKLLQSSGFKVAELAIRMSKDSFKSFTELGVVCDEYFLGKSIKDNFAYYMTKIKEDPEFVKKIGLTKYKPFGVMHSSVLEHVTLSFYLKFPRNVLQELSRHRVGVSPTVRSTRYTLNQLIEVYERGDYSEVFDYIRDLHYVDIDYDYCSFLIDAMNNLEYENNLNPDNLKNYLLESFETEGIYTFNLRSLRTLFELRVSRNVFKPFRMLCLAIYDCLADDYKIFFEEYKEEILKTENK